MAPSLLVLNVGDVPQLPRPPRHGRAAWDARRAQAGRYPSLGADWRTDVRCQQTGDPTDPTYREWTHQEIWDLITANGQNADPREVALWVRDPLEIAGRCRPRSGGSGCGAHGPLRRQGSCVCVGHSCGVPTCMHSCRCLPRCTSASRSLPHRCVKPPSFVQPPMQPADAPAQGGKYTMDPEEYFESVGALIREDELAAIASSAGGADGEADGASLLAAEFSDFDDGLGDFDADYAAGGSGGDDHDF